jgi:hypothetical protein
MVIHSDEVRKHACRLVRGGLFPESGNVFLDYKDFDGFERFKDPKHGSDQYSMPLGLIFYIVCRFDKGSIRNRLNRKNAQLRKNPFSIANTGSLMAC